MQNTQPSANQQKRHSRLLAAASAAVIVVVGLGAFALAPDHQAAPPVPHSTEAFAANVPDEVRAFNPRACWRTARHSASPIWWSA